MVNPNHNNIMQKIERFIGGLKLAIVLILTFIVALAVGTFAESYHGTEYANRLIYKSPWFMLLQFFLFLSIFMATLLRLPPKKRLYGFYIIHTGLILVFCGSFVTFHAGIDGNMTLYPNTPTRSLSLPHDVFTITYSSPSSSEDAKGQKQITYKLPYVAGPYQINQQWEDIQLETYLPFSENKLEWIPFTNENSQSYHSSEYLISNDRVSQTFMLSLHPESTDTFPASVTLGPLNIHYLPQELFSCFGRSNPSQMIVWNSQQKSCLIPEENNIPIKTTQNGHRFLVVPGKGPHGEPKFFTFFPDFSPWPLNEQLTMIENSPLRIFSQKLFEDRPNLFLFGHGVAFFDKEKKQWVTQEISLQQSLELPWMQFQLKLLDHREKERPENIPLYSKPIQDNGQTIQGDQKALLVKVKGQSYWVKDQSPLGLLVNGQKVTMALQKETLILPFELNLDQFKMDTDPGTNSPASYESFVTLFHPEGHNKHHVYMNNPLKYEKLTFYQASYFQTEQGYGSVLSVNFDPGRFLKYFGSLFLVLGAIIHYQLNKDRYGKKMEKKKLSAEDSPINLQKKGHSPLLEV